MVTHLRNAIKQMCAIRTPGHYTYSVYAGPRPNAIALAGEEEE